jgi:hypothetical protein
MELETKKSFLAFCERKMSISNTRKRQKLCFETFAIFAVSDFRQKFLQNSKTLREKSIVPEFKWYVGKVENFFFKEIGIFASFISRTKLLHFRKHYHKTREQMLQSRAS